jgi:hypothetical protein
VIFRRANLQRDQGDMRNCRNTLLRQKQVDTRRLVGSVIQYPSLTLTLLLLLRMGGRIKHRLDNRR